MPQEFIVDGTKFRQSPLNLKESLRAESILVGSALPGLLAAQQGVLDSSAVVSILAGLDRIGELVDLFAAHAEADRGGTYVALQPFLDSTFELRNAALLIWLCECVEYQFADFFVGTGLKLLEAKASNFSFLRDSTGESGDS